MYSYKERKKAVELYIKFDKSASAAVRELGYRTIMGRKLDSGCGGV